MARLEKKVNDMHIKRRYACMKARKDHMSTCAAPGAAPLFCVNMLAAREPTSLYAEVDHMLLCTNHYVQHQLPARTNSATMHHTVRQRLKVP